jgi:hypothetical protein
MAYKISKNAREVATIGPSGNVILSHAKLQQSDIEWLHDVEQILLWNVAVPLGLLAEMKCLSWLTWTGGSAQNIPGLAIGECPNLRCLDISHVRGLTDLSFLPSLEKLELLSVYAQKQILEMPSLAAMGKLRRIELGQMKSLSSIMPVLDAPVLEDLLLLKTVPIGLNEADRINALTTLKGFYWDWADAPDKVAVPVLDRIQVPALQHLHKNQWFGSVNPTQVG